MSTVYKYRWGTTPNYNYEWRLSTDPVPDPNAVVVEAVSDDSTILRQERKTVGHYHAIPILISAIAAGATKYKDIIVPDYTNGWDVLGAEFMVDNADPNDQIVVAKAIMGKIGSLAVATVNGATVVTVASTKGILKSTLLGGALDEGFYLSFGTENTTDSSLNAGGSELTEYEVKRIGAETDIGGGNATCSITLFTGVPVLAANIDVNLVIRFVKSPFDIIKAKDYRLGLETLQAGNIPANKIFRIGYKNTGSANKDVKGYLAVLY